MTDHPIPDDLLDRMAHALIDAPLTDSLSTNNLLGGWGDESAIADLAHAALQSLAEWADGGLIDPSTWTVVEAERETGWCVYKGHGPDCECNAGTRWVLSPREGER